MNPEDAVKALADCGAAQALAHHHGTFQLTDEAIDAPVIALGEALDEAKIPRERFVALKPGQVVEIYAGRHCEPKRRCNPKAARADWIGSASHALLAIDGFYCPCGLIAQDTLTVTCSVSSPGATGAEAAMPAAILRNGAGPGAPSSEMLTGEPSVTPAALA